MSKILDLRAYWAGMNFVADLYLSSKGMYSGRNFWAWHFYKLRCKNGN